MPAQRKKKTPPFSLRLTREERQVLEMLAKGVPLGKYIRARVFGGTADTTFNSPGDLLPPDRKALSQALGELGKSQLAKDINRLAKAALDGTFPLPPDVTSLLQQAADDISAIKRMLMTKLGIKED